MADTTVGAVPASVDPVKVSHDGRLVAFQVNADEPPESPCVGNSATVLPVPIVTSDSDNGVGFGAALAYYQGDGYTAPYRFAAVAQVLLTTVGVSDDYDALAKAEQEVGALSASISATRSSAYYLDVTDIKANKGEVVVTLSQMLSIPTEQIVTIGDMSTDALMFHTSGISIAMGNALDDVKAQATYVTRTNQEDGFAYAMDHFILASAGQRLAAD